MGLICGFLPASRRRRSRKTDLREIVTALLYLAAVAVRNLEGDIHQHPYRLLKSTVSKIAGLGADNPALLQRVKTKEVTTIFGYR